MKLMEIIEINRDTTVEVLIEDEHKEEPKVRKCRLKDI